MGATVVRPTWMSSLRVSMRALLTLRRLLTVALLVAAWCALWGSVSVANVLSGTLIAVAATLFSGIDRSAGGLHIVALLHFVWLVAVDLVVSTVYVAWEILTPTDYTDEAIIAVEIPRDGRHHFLLLIIAVTLTPGTAVVDADPDSGTLYLHLLHADRRDDVAEHVEQLTRLACEALPTTPIPRPLGTTS